MAPALRLKVFLEWKIPMVRDEREHRLLTLALYAKLCLRGTIGEQVPIEWRRFAEGFNVSMGPNVRDPTVREVCRSLAMLIVLH
jgi:hypothetical protein